MVNRMNLIDRLYFYNEGVVYYKIGSESIFYYQFPIVADWNWYF